ncbi:MAG: 4-(cytidine 5'-diphospho)-2-C-methyl-D-erythritol kinase [Emcibacteraceae bacterium]|nr:4-(cytidine 5'-diphospho)-2-C-methyl-D-erythritol kinase [Emcibacteraceae bacterium]
MLAPAKINLDLLITGKRNDGYHLLDSVVVFADCGDELFVEKSDELTLTITGPFAQDLSTGPDNLVLKAAQLICNECNVKPNLKFHLVKNIPVASGIGGGSADAAAALKLTVQALALDIEPIRLEKIALSIGADVPVCLRSETTRMMGIGDLLSPLPLKEPLFGILVNSGVTVSTPIIFKEYANAKYDYDQRGNTMPSHVAIDFLKDSHNSLERIAAEIEPNIDLTLQKINNTDDVMLSRMSGSGATCFGVYSTREKATSASQMIKNNYPLWWVMPFEVI